MINYLLDPFIQIENKNGQPVVGAKIYVYYTGSRTLAPIYSNKSGTSLANPAITDTLGNVTIFAKTGSFYDVLVYDNDGTLLFSKINVTPSDSTAANVREVDIVAGFGIQVHKRYQGNKAIYNVAIDPDEAATQADVAAKQDKLTPGANIEITQDNTINVVNRKTLYTQWPLKVDRGSSMVKLYLDDNYSNDFKTVQESVSYGGNDKYISEILQNENGEINATVQTMPDVPTYTAGNGISIENNVISCSGDIIPYTAGSNVTIADHEISSKDWTTDINNAATTNNWDVTPYTAGTGISITDHEISCTVGKISQYNVSIPNDGTTVTIHENTNIDNFIIEGKYNSTNSNYEIIIRNANSVSRYIKVFPISNTGITISNGNNNTIATAGLYNSAREHIEIFGMGVSTEKPRGEYTLYTDPYVDRLEVTLYEIQPYSL